MEKQWLYQPYILIAIVLLFFVQQIIMTHDSRARTIDPYATTTKTLTDSSYYNHKLAKKLIILKQKIIKSFPSYRLHVSLCTQFTIYLPL